MDFGLPVWVSPLLAVILIAVAIVLALAASGPVLRDPAGPTLPERLHRWRRQQRFALAVAFAPQVLAGLHVFWTIPLAWMALQAVSHRVRRTVFGDTWSLAGQLAWNGRVFLAGPGFWWAVSLAPLILAASDAPPWTVVGTGVVLLIWHHLYAPIVLAVLRARPIVDRPELDAAFAPVLARIRIPAPRLMHAGPRGARLANAFALTSIHGDTVLFLDGLLEGATPEEAAGVLAHEIGHLEDFATRRAGLYAHGALLAAGATIVSLLLPWFSELMPAWIPAVLWFGVAMGSLIARAVRSQTRETASDRRAVELCGGDGEALIRALLLLYQTAQMPRRLAPAEEQRASHPGLGRRIRAIRAASGAPPPLIEPRAFAADGVPRAVLFESQRLVFVSLGEAPDLADLTGLVQRASQVQAMPYADLIEIRIEAGRSLPAVLVAASRDGGRHRLRIALADVPAVQALMDAVEQRMTPVAAAARTPQLASVLGRFTALLALIALVLPTPLVGALVPALLACIRPTIALMTALAGATLAATMVPGPSPTPTRLLALILAAFACLAVAAREARAARAEPRPFAWDGFLVLQAILIGGVALLFGVPLAISGAGGVVPLHVMARTMPSAGAGFAALGGLLLVVPRWHARAVAVVALALAGLVTWAGSSAFRDRYAPDALIAAAPRLGVDPLPASPLRTLAIAGSQYHLRLSPDGRHVLTASLPRHFNRQVTHLVAGMDGFRRTLEAQDVAFVGPDTLFVVRSEGHARVLSAEGLRDGSVRWSLRVDERPGLTEVDDAGRWRITSPDVGSDGARVLLEGRVGDASAHAATGRYLAVRRRWSGGMNPLAWLAPQANMATALVRVAPDGSETAIVRTRLMVDCRDSSLSAVPRTCLVIEGGETTVWDVDVEHGHVRPTAWTPHVMTATAIGDRLLVAWHDRALLGLWRGTSRAVRLADLDRCPCPHEAAYAAGHLATMTTEANETTVALYAVTPPAPAAATRQ